MKNILWTCLIISSILSIYSFKAPNEIILEERFIVPANILIEDESILMAEDADNNRVTVEILICPGTGVDCIIRGHDADGEPTTITGKKGKGRGNIEVTW